jgi:altronate dehydratase
MNSPGNDLESVAGQVAAGCNVIFFVTGNGSITNFPFVPTIKIVTTTRRHELLPEEMDVKAGAYLDGKPMEQLAKEMLAATIDVVSGAPSAGERACHSQVQIWRSWQRTEARDQGLQDLQPVYRGQSLPIRKYPVPELHAEFPAFRIDDRVASDQIGLILPTSLCAGQIARMTAQKLNAARLGRENSRFRFVALSHTEGCGASSGESEELYVRTLLGYLQHPLVRHSLFLEHGCENTHNDYMRSKIREIGLDPERFGWASVQMDGGLAQVMDKITAWFGQALAASASPVRETAGPVTMPASLGLGRLTRAVAAAGGTVVVPESDGLLASAAYLDETLGEYSTAPSLDYGQHISDSGFHIMASPTRHTGEILTGLGACGVEILLAYISDQPIQGHPMIPVLQITGERGVSQRFASDIDLFLDPKVDRWPEGVVKLVSDVLAGQFQPRLFQ